MKLPPTPVMIVGCLVVALGLGFIFLYNQFPGALEGRDRQIRLVQVVLILSVFLIPAMFAKKIRAKQAVRSVLIWGGIGFVVFVGYTFKDDMAYVFTRLAGELVPGYAQSTGTSEVIRAGANGHFSVWAEVDGSRIRFLVDTGATHVVLSPKDAKTLGFDLEKLTYSQIFNTANGTVRGAPVTLGRLSIGSIHMDDVRAYVNSADMGGSLLGMGYLRRLSRFEVDGNTLTLTP